MLSILEYIENHFNIAGNFLEITVDDDSSIAPELLKKGWKGTLAFNKGEKVFNTEDLYTIKMLFPTLSCAKLSQLLQVSKIKFFDIIILNHPDNDNIFAQIDLAFLQPLCIIISNGYPLKWELIDRALKQDDQYCCTKKTEEFIVFGRE